jgi:hypothetical protein
MVQVFPDWERNNYLLAAMVIYQQTYASVTALWGTAADFFVCTGRCHGQQKGPRISESNHPKSDGLRTPATIQEPWNKGH